MEEKGKSELMGAYLITGRDRGEDNAIGREAKGQEEREWGGRRRGNWGNGRKWQERR